MKRTRLESVGLTWHMLQVLVATYLLAGPKSSAINPGPMVWAILIIPFALGCWIGGLLQRPTAVTLLLAAIFWSAMAVHIEGSYTFAFSMGVRVFIRIVDNPKISIDVLVACAAGIFFVAHRRQRLAIGSSDHILDSV
jgi:hypothetical protein